MITVPEPPDPPAELIVPGALSVNAPPPPPEPVAAKPLPPTLGS